MPLLIAVGKEKFDEKLRLAKKYNIGVELVLFQDQEKLFDTNNLEKIKRALNDINNVVIHGPYSFLNSKDSVMEIIERTFFVSNFLNSKKLVFHTGYNENNMGDVISFWKEVSSLAPDGLSIYLENTREEPQEMKHILDGIQDDKFKICMDIGHLLVHSKSDINFWIETLGERISYIHIHNNDGMEDQHLPLAMGKFNMKELYDKIKQLDVSLEAFGDIEILESDIRNLISWSKL